MEPPIPQHSCALPGSFLVLCVSLLLSFAPSDSFCQCGAAPIAVATCTGGNGAASSGITIGTGTVYWMNSTATFSTLTLNGGTLRVCGTLTISSLTFNSGNIVVESGGILIIQGFSSVFLGGNVIFVNRGTIEITSSFTLQNAGNGIYNDLSTSIFEVSGVVTVNNAQIVNRGVMTLAGLNYQGPAGGFCVQDQSITSIYSLTNNTINSFVYSGTGSSACLNANGPVASTVLNDNLTSSPSIHVCQNFTGPPSGGADANPGNGWGSAKVYAGCSSCATVLVLGIIGFSATRSGDLVELQWSSGQGVDVNGIYYVERSTDGVGFETFTMVVPAVGESAFAATDAGVLAPKLYYRVRSVSSTGTTLYSNVALVESDEVGPFQVFPNPVQSNSAITVVLPASITGTAQLSLMDMSGKLVAVKMVVPASHSFSWMLPRLAAGIYVIRLESTSGNYYGRIVVHGN